MQFTRQVDIRIYFTHTVFISSLSFLKLVINWKCQEGSCSDVIMNVNIKAAMKFRIIDFLNGI